MNQVIKTSHQLSSSVDKVWECIKDGTGVDKWLPVITDCQLNGDGAGAKRICTLEQGRMLETILKIDHENRIFQYAIDEQPLLPIENIIGTMQVKENGEGSVLTWDLSFNLENANLLSTVTQAIEGLYAAGANGLEELSNSK